MRGHGAGHYKSMDDTLAMLASSSGSEAGAIIALLSNRVQQPSPAGTVVAAGTAITPDASLTLLADPASTILKVRISASASFTSGAGTVRPFLQVALNGGAFATVYSWATTSDTVGDADAVFIEIPAGAVPGDVVHVHWQTTAGDAAATLGNAAAGGQGAILLVEQVL